MGAGAPSSLPKAHTGEVLRAWSAADPHHGRRFSVHLDPTADQTARETATALLALPWELLHDDTGFLFQGARPTRVRRRLPGPRDQHSAPSAGQPRAAICWW